MSTTTDAAAGGLLLSHAREAIRLSRAYYALIEKRRCELEAEGYRLVGGGATGSDETGESEWEITDYRTGQTLASGTGHGGYEAAATRLDAENAAAGGRGICHDDHVPDSAAEALLALPPPPGGIPPSLANAVAEWAENSQGDQDAMRFLGLGSD